MDEKSNLEEEEVYLLAVYGTLKENFPNYFYYINPKVPIFRGLVKLPFQMHSNGGFPLLFPSESFNQIYIEIFEVNSKTLEKIDRLEGVPHFYKRLEIFIPEITKNTFIYVITDQEPYGNLIEDGFFPKKE